MHWYPKILSQSIRRIKFLLPYFLLICIGTVSEKTLNAQELFPLSEPASTIPKRTIGIRLYSESYKEIYQWRNVSYLRLMYGLTPRLSVYLSAIASNHHGVKLPEEFPFHNTPERGKVYPYKFNGFWLYGKYRFLSVDGHKSHFRIAAYAEATSVKTTHHETEPSLEYGDNSGMGLGLITTILEDKFAASLTTGAIFPFAYDGWAPDPVQGLPDIPETVFYGKAFLYRLSLGFRVLPFHYNSYKQGNLNVYAEFRGQIYGAAKVNVFAGMPNEYYLQNEQYPLALQGASYIDFSPGIQYIYKSNLRIDFSTTFRWLGFSYARLYPVYSIGIQRYFYPHARKQH